MSRYVSSENLKRSHMTSLFYVRRHGYDAQYVDIQLFTFWHAERWASLS